MQCHFMSGKASHATTAPSIPHTPAMLSSYRQLDPPGAMQCLNVTSRCGLIYNPRGAHLVTSVLTEAAAVNACYFQLVLSISPAAL